MTAFSRRLLKILGDFQLGAYFNLDKNKISNSTAKEWNIEDTIKIGRIEIKDIEYKLSGISRISPTVIDNIIYDGVLNHDFLSQFMITISAKEKEIWIK